MLIEPFAPVKDIRLILDKSRRFCKGFGHVEFFDEASQKLVLKQSFELQGRPLFMEPFYEGGRLAQKKKAFLARRIFVSNLSSSVSDEELVQIFSKFGEVETAYRIVSSKNQKRPFGFVLFVDSKAAKACHNQYKVKFKGRFIFCRSFKKGGRISELDHDDAIPENRHKNSSKTSNNKGSDTQINFPVKNKGNTSKRRISEKRKRFRS